MIRFLQLMMNAKKNRFYRQIEKNTGWKNDDYPSAHRLSAVQHADLILVVEDGKITRKWQS